MSVREGPASSQSGGQSKGTVGLKRKLTGPPRLLLGKAKAKRQLEKRTEAQAKRVKGRENSNGNRTSSHENHQVLQAKDEMPREYSENSKLQEDADMDTDTRVKRSPWVDEGEHTLGSSGVQSTETELERDEHLEVKMRNKSKQLRGGQEHSIKPSLLCLRKKRSKLEKTASIEDDKQNSDKTFSHAELVSPAGTSTEQLPKVKGKFPSGMWTSFKKLVSLQSKSQKSKEGQLNYCFGHEETEATCKNKYSITAFFKHKTKQTSDSFHEDTCKDKRQQTALDKSGNDTKGERSNRNVEGIHNSPDDVYGSRNEDGGNALPSELLTVNVEVSELNTKGIKGDAHSEKTVERMCEDSEMIQAAAQNMLVGCKAGDEEVSWGSPEAGTSSGFSKTETTTVEEDKPNKEADTVSPENHCVDSNFSKYDPSFNPDVDSHKSLMFQVNTRVTDCKDLSHINISSSRLETIGNGAEPEPGYSPEPDSNKTKESVMNETMAINDTLVFHKVENSVSDCLINSSAGVPTDLEKPGEKADDCFLSPKSTHLEENCVLPDCVSEEHVDLQSDEFLLMQTACSLVQAAMRAALDQVTDDLEDTPVNC
ncbi:UNVERIFIED_CONTAM: hypothetical protein FKN15_031832 [Acipenser sinensis]